MESEICVVGGGPAGLIAAKSAGEEGRRVTLFDSREKIGSYEHCAGLLSVDGLQKLGLDKLPSEVIQNNCIKGAHVYSPSGNSITVQKQSTTAYVVNRAKFNEYLHQNAQDAGVITRVSSRVIDIQRNEDKLQLKVGKKGTNNNINCKIAILAEGRFPKLNAQVGLHVPSRKNIVYSAMYIMSNVKNIDTEYVELYQDQKFAPGFFSWIIPIDERTAKVGMASSKIPASEYLNSFIRKHPVAKSKLKTAQIQTKMSGAIPLGGTIKRSYTDNILVVGDAAGQTKPTTGGGVIFGGIAATIAGKIAHKALKLDDYSKKNLREYSILWQQELRSNLFIMKQVRKYLDVLNEKEIEKLFNILNRSSMLNQISNKGDVDNQKDIVLKMLMNLKLWPFFLITGLKFLLKKGI